MTTMLLQKDHEAILGRFGLALDPNGELSLQDALKAERADLHHTLRPIAAVGWIRTAPEVARDRLNEYTLADFVTKRPAMSDSTAEAFAAVCGAPHTQGPFFRRSEPFFNYIQGFIEKYDIGRFYGHFPSRGGWHMAIRPRGVDWHGDERLIPSELRRFRRDFMAVPEPTRMLVATVLWLYRGGKDDHTWLKGLRRHWNGVDAIMALNMAGMRADWGELIARYPGW